MTRGHSSSLWIPNDAKLVNSAECALKVNHPALRQTASFRAISLKNRIRDESDGNWRAAIKIARNRIDSIGWWSRNSQQCKPCWTIHFASKQRFNFVKWERNLPPGERFWCCFSLLFRTRLCLLRALCGWTWNESCVAQKFYRFTRKCPTKARTNSNVYGRRTEWNGNI